MMVITPSLNIEIDFRATMSLHFCFGSRLHEIELYFDRYAGFRQAFFGI